MFPEPSDGCLFFVPFQQIIHKPTHELKQQLANYSKRVAGSVTELIQAAEAMKGSLTYGLSDIQTTHTPYVHSSSFTSPVL